MRKTIIFGHRGYPAKFAENSLAGFRYAASHGAEGVEFDVQLSKDGVPVIMHDERIDRTTSGHGWLHDYSLKQLRQMHLANGEPIPELAELFKVLQDKDLRINLEFKTSIVHYPHIEETVLKLARHYHFKHPIIYSSFDYVTLKNCQAIDPSQTYCYLVNQKVLDPERLIRENHFAGIHPAEFLPSSKPITERIWTVNDAALAKKYFREGAAGLFTNDYVKMIKLRDQIEGVKNKQ